MSEVLCFGAHQDRSCMSRKALALIVLFNVRISLKKNVCLCALDATWKMEIPVYSTLHGDLISSLMSSSTCRY